MPITNLPDETDGIQISIQSFISNATPETIFHKILFTLWYIWKARNDYHFNRKQWTSARVHQAVSAHMDSLNQAALIQQPLYQSYTIHQDISLEEGMATLSAGTTSRYPQQQQSTPTSTDRCEASHTVQIRDAHLALHTSPLQPLQQVCNVQTQLHVAKLSTDRFLPWVQHSKLMSLHLLTTRKVPHHKVFFLHKLCLPKKKNKERSQKVSGKLACLVVSVQAWDGKNKYSKAPKVVLCCF